MPRLHDRAELGLDIESLDMESLEECGCDAGCVFSNNDGLGRHRGEKAE
jgi:hypothetical protein